MGGVAQLAEHLFCKQKVAGSNPVISTNPHGNQQIPGAIFAHTPEALPACYNVAVSTTLHNFGNGGGLVPAHRHRNPDGTLGGWVADSAMVQNTVYIGPSAQVFDHAVVTDHVALHQRAWIAGRATVSDNVKMSNTAGVYGNAKVSGCVQLYDRAAVFGEAIVSDDVYLADSASLSDHAEAHHSAVIAGATQIRDHGQVIEQASVSGNTLIFGNAVIAGNAVITMGNYYDTQASDFHLDFSPADEINNILALDAAIG